jgi:hypothetical protein
MIYLLLIPYFIINTAYANVSERDIFTPTIAKNGMVVTGEEIATQVGVEVLQKGGNAIDAAVTVGFVKAVNLVVLLKTEQSISKNTLQLPLYFLSLMVAFMKLEIV